MIDEKKITELMKNDTAVGLTIQLVTDYKNKPETFQSKSELINNIRKIAEKYGTDLNNEEAEIIFNSIEQAIASTEDSNNFSTLLSDDALENVAGGVTVRAGETINIIIHMAHNMIDRYKHDYDFRLQINELKQLFKKPEK